jgi:heavy metal translocating P-type ATPase
MVEPLTHSSTILLVGGMTCSACIQAVEKTVQNHPNVQSCSVNLVQRQALVEWKSADSENLSHAIQSVITAIEKAGYTAEAIQNMDPIEALQRSVMGQKKTIQELFTSALWSTIATVLLMGLALPWMAFEKPSPLSFLHSWMHVFHGWLPSSLQMPTFFGVALQTIIVILVWVFPARRWLTQGLRSMWHQQPHMFSLIGLSSIAAFALSTYSVWDAAARANYQVSAIQWSLTVMYYEAAVAPLALALWGKLFEHWVLWKFSAATVLNIPHHSDQVTCLEEDGSSILRPAQDVRKGDVVLYSTGHVVAADGMIIDGQAEVDTAMLTGESAPVLMQKGHEIKRGMPLIQGLVQVRVSAAPSSSLLADLALLLLHSSPFNNPPQMPWLPRILQFFTWGVIATSALTGIVWWTFSLDMALSLQYALTVLVVACPCALGLAVPAAFALAHRQALINGLWIRDGLALYRLAFAKLVILDKTGTLTTGQMGVVQTWTLSNIPISVWLSSAAAIEQSIEHPTARAIVAYARSQHVPIKQAKEVRYHVGVGVRGIVQEDSQQHNIEVISLESFIASSVGSFSLIPEEAQHSSHTLIVCLFDKQIVGLLAIADTIRDDAQATISTLQQQGCDVYMLSGDRDAVCQHVAQKLSIQHVISQCSPEDKAQFVTSLSLNGIEGDTLSEVEGSTIKEGLPKGNASRGSVVFVGDGLNDSLALRAADVGIAMGSGSSLNQLAGSMVLMKNQLQSISKTITTAQHMNQVAYSNLMLSAVYNVIMIPLAAGVGVFLWGLHFTPMMASMAMMLSSVSVLLNSMRLLSRY